MKNLNNMGKLSERAGRKAKGAKFINIASQLLSKQRYRKSPQFCFEVVSYIFVMSKWLIKPGFSKGNKQNSNMKKYRKIYSKFKCE